jgi:hypothetical protein
MCFADALDPKAIPVPSVKARRIASQMFEWK